MPERTHGARAPLTRRQALRTGVAVGLTGLALPGAAACAPGPPADAIAVAGGESGGFYLEFATLLAASLERHRVARTATALETGGSLDNMDRLAHGGATLAIALSDAAADRLASQRMLALGKVYENYLHCVIRRDSGISSVADLAGRAVAVGDPRSGTSLTAHRLLESAGLASAPSSTPQLGLNQGLAALRDGTVEALFWSGGVPTAAVTAFAKTAEVRLLDLSALIPALKGRFGAFYDRVLIREDSYEGVPATWTVGVANLLLCREDLPSDVARATAGLLLQHSGELVPGASRGVQYLSPETLISTAGVPLHPGAEDAYRSIHG